MTRKNNKVKLISYENSIQKSNDFSMAKLSRKLTLNQMQLLAYAIFSTQQNGKTEFIKADFERKFELGEYRREEAKEDSRKLFELEFSLDDLDAGDFDYLHVFQRINYTNGLFTFKWSEDMIPHILDLKDHYITNGFLTIANFKSGFSWILYDYIKAHYNHWHISISKESLMKLFNVENVKTYQRNTGRFKQAVLGIATAEINKHTELEVWYTEKKVGNKITGFTLRWSTGQTSASATDKQTTLLREIHDEVEKNMLDYLSLKDVQGFDQARRHIISIKEINNAVNKGLSVEKADEFIQEALTGYQQLEKLLEDGGEKRDTSVYYNWLEENKE